MTWLSWFLSALLLLKLAWNMLVPFFLERAARSAAPIHGRSIRGVSMMPIVETALLVAIALAAAIRFRNEQPAAHAGGVLAVGIAAIALSYLVAVFWGRYLRRSDRPRQSPSQAE